MELEVSGVADVSSRIASAWPMRHEGRAGTAPGCGRMRSNYSDVVYAQLASAELMSLERWSEPGRLGAGRLMPSGTWGMSKTVSVRRASALH